MAQEWEQEFERLVEDIEISDVGTSVVNINQVIWRLNEAAMFLSRFIQYGLLNPDTDFPDEVIAILPHLAFLAGEASVLLQKHEEGRGCLDCLEAEQLGLLGVDEDED